MAGLWMILGALNGLVAVAAAAGSGRSQQRQYLRRETGEIIRQASFD